MVDKKVSKRKAIFHLPRTKKEEHANAIFCPCGQKSMCSKPNIHFDSAEVR